MYDNVSQVDPPLGYQNVSVHPMGGRLNLARHHVAEDEDQSAHVGYVLYKLSDARSRPTRVMTSDRPIAQWRLGSTLRLYDKATGSLLGKYKIVGARDATVDENAGDVPDRNDILWCRADRVW